MIHYYVLRIIDANGNLMKSALSFIKMIEPITCNLININDLCWLSISIECTTSRIPLRAPQAEKSDRLTGAGPVLSPNLNATSAMMIFIMITNR